MANNKHLTLDDRLIIEYMLKDKSSFKMIGNALMKDPTTISKEIRSRLIFRRIGAINVNYNACTLRFTCTKARICSPCHSERKFKLCQRCSMCNSFCKDFQKQDCTRLEKPPYICNGCSQRFRCSLEKRFYNAQYAQKEYRDVLSESRSGISFSEDEIRYLDELITPLIKQNQSPRHICVTNRDSIMVSERTIYRLVDARILSAMNIDLPRKVRYRARKKTVYPKVDKSCRIGRDYECFLAYIKDNPDTPITQLDTVEGKKGGKVLLTIHFVKAEMMLAFLREHNDSRSVIDIFDALYRVLGPVNFTKLFKVCLTDNGSEFSNPSSIEFDDQKKQRARIFYCNPSAPHQKGSAERNHEFIRCFIPKGTDLGTYTQEDINRMMDHINSYHRESIGDKSPYDMFAFLHGEDILDLFECHRIPPQEVTLNKSIFSKGAGQ